MSRTETWGETTVSLLAADDAGDEVEVRGCPGGPMLVRGAEGIRDAAGDVHAVTRPVVAVCACGKSQRRPWCDGTHKVIRG